MNKKNKTKKLKLDIETLRTLVLSSEQLRNVVGGTGTGDPVSEPTGGGQNSK